MFQRIKGAIDSKIAEEQARQRLSHGSPSRSGSSSKKSSSRAISPTKNSARQGVRGRRDGDILVKGPDPTDFDQEFVIDEDELSRSGTPRPPLDRNGSTAAEKASDGGQGETPQEVNGTGAVIDEPSTSSELPTDVRVKLRKLEKLESRYHELLRSYRVAHARVLTIEPFENTLRENTPLTSISDPKALVEYLNQVNLKGDMVLDELKRVSSERDTYKQRLSEAEKSAKEAWNEVADLRRPQTTEIGPQGGVSQASNSISEDDRALEDGDPLGATSKSPSQSIKSPTVSVRGMSLFSPKSKPAESTRTQQSSEDLFSYDSEIPRLESELEERETRIGGLEKEVKSLRGDLAVTRESTQSMVQTLEEATRELNGLRDSKERSSSAMEEQKAALEKLREDLQVAEDSLREQQNTNSSSITERIRELEADIETKQQELDVVRSSARQDAHYVEKIDDLESTIAQLQLELANSRKEGDAQIQALNKTISDLRNSVKAAEDKNTDLNVVIDKSSKACEALQNKVQKLELGSRLHDKSATNEDSKPDSAEPSAPILQSTNGGSGQVHDMSNAIKKKNKKKRKNNKAFVEQEKVVPTDPELELGSKADESPKSAVSEIITGLQQELRQLRCLLEEKDAAIARISSKLKDEDGLREEIETLRDDLINVGQEHVETKDTVKALKADKTSLESTVSGLEKEIAGLRSFHETGAADMEQKHQVLATEFEDLKSKASTLQTDLAVAQQLASSRFKDLNDLRNVLQKAQPEINALRSEAAEVKSLKETLEKKDAEFKRLDSRHAEMRLEVTSLKQSISDRELEIKSLRQQVSQESNSKIKAEEAGLRDSQNIQCLENEKCQANEALENLSKELSKARNEMDNDRIRLKDIEQQLSKTKSDSEGLKEEVELKSAQYASAQSLMASMRDQTTEMAMQMKEARDRCDSLDEEVADAHRLLGERSREGETMRRLLADVEGRADARTREMKERMDIAIEERDRAEDEASTASRRRAREMEDLRNKYRNIETNLKRAEEDKEALEIAQRDWKRRREALEIQEGQSSKDLGEVRTAMGELRDALDESERQARELEKQKAELRRSVEDTQHRLEKLQKSNKSMADEISKMQTARAKGLDSGGQSSRSSLETPSRLGSPTPKRRTGSAALIKAPNGQPAGTMDYIYLKNVLLQFLEQKDKKHQMQLIPVLGMLLHFDRTDEQRWMSAVATKA